MKICFILASLFSLCSSFSYAQGNINQSDMTQAQSFVSSLPKACGSNIGTRNDGSVVVSYSCPGKDGSVAIGNIYIKDGKITKMN